MPRSKFHEPGLRIMFRGWMAKVPGAGRANAAGLNQAIDVVNGPGSIVGSPIRFQNWLPLPGPTPAKSSLLRTENGPPDWNWYTPVISQWPKARDAQPESPRRNGSSYIQLAISTCVRSRSEMPQYALSSYAFGRTSVSDDELSCVRASV